MMRFDIVTVFPDMFSALTDFGVTGRALRSGVADLRFWNPRDYTDDPHHTVDDRPYGGGPGMVMLAEPLARCVEAVRADGGDHRVVYLSPQGRRLDHGQVMALCGGGGLTLIAGRYSGVDQRFIDSFVDEELSIGDYVLSGGELAVMVVIEAIVRQLPGALGNVASPMRDTFAAGQFGAPEFTRPEVWRGREVPAVLLSGNHAMIDAWRNAESARKTRSRRPDLLRAEK